MHYIILHLYITYYINNTHDANTLADDTPSEKWRLSFHYLIATTVTATASLADWLPYRPARCFTKKTPLSFFHNKSLKRWPIYRLLIDTDMLLIITNISDYDFEQLWTPKLGVLVIFLRFSVVVAHTARTQTAKAVACRLRYAQITCLKILKDNR